MNEGEGKKASKKERKKEIRKTSSSIRSPNVILNRR